MHFDEAMNESNVRFFMGTSAQRSTTLGKLHYCLVCVGRSALSKTRSIQSLHSFTFRGQYKWQLARRVAQLAPLASGSLKKYNDRKNTYT